MSPLSDKNVARERILNELWDQAARIRTAGQLFDYAGRFPSPAAGAIIQQALRYFAQRKIKKDGTRDGVRMAFNSQKLGFGRRLRTSDHVADWFSTPSGQSRSLILGLWFWIETEAPKYFTFYYTQLMLHKKDFGIEDPRELASIFITYIGWQERGFSKPTLPDRFR